MSRFGASFAAGLLQGGMRGYLMGKDLERQGEKDALDKEERTLRIDALRRKAADDQELRTVLQGPDATGMTDGTRPAILESFGYAADGTPATAPEQPAASAAQMPVSAPPVERPSVGPAGSTAPTPDAPAADLGAQQPGGVVAGIAAGQQAAAAPGVAQQITQATQQRNQFDVDKYLTETGPRVVQTLVQQGRLSEARAFTEFADSQQGRAYSTSWAGGVRKLSMGDTAGALRDFEDLYNHGLPDGNTIKLKPLEGDRFAIEQYGRDGKLLGSREGSGQQIASAAAAFLSPSEAVKHFAAAQAKSAAADDTTARQEAIERLRQQGRADADERSAERTRMTIDAADARAARQIAASDARLERSLSRDRPLTPAQARSNAEIQAARDAVADLTPEEIRRRTSPTTATGRENPDFDPSLSRLAKLTMRRKIGDDAEFDDANRAPDASTPAAAGNRSELAKRFRSDHAMANFKLGRDTERGTEVLDSSGKLVGYYR